MLLRFLATPILVLPLLSSGAIAGGLPLIKATNSNKVPACATPGRLMAQLKDRNPGLKTQHANIAHTYKSHGTALGVRWDYAFFQMIVETGALKYRRGDGSPSDVRPKQNNFAGLGATGNGEHGEAFDTISDGVKAHLQHLQMYAGVHVADPVAERTRKVQSWGIFKKWHKRLRHRVTFRHLAKKWAPGSKGYARDIASVGASFYKSYCNRLDPDPKADPVTVAAPKNAAGGKRGNMPLKSDRLAALAEKNALGARGSRAERDGRSSATLQTKAGIVAGLQVINPSGTTNGGDTTSAADPKNDSGTGYIALPTRKPVKLAAAARAAAKRSVARSARSKPKKCRVWTASYGGQKAVLIKSETKDFTNYTVLDVHTGKEKREATAYIAAYARGGRKLADFSTQTLALNKAFKLCPEG